MEDLEKVVSSEEDRHWCVYIHTNKTNNKKYVGYAKNIDNRWKENGNGYLYKKSDGTYKQRAFAGAINLYGLDGFDHDVIQNNLTEREAKQLEKELIALYKTNCCKYKNPTYGYNMTDGGEGVSGYIYSKEARQKISQAQIGRTVSDDIRAKISEALTGRRLSDETKTKIGDANRGKSMPEEQKQKLLEINTGRIKSEEERNKISVALKGKQFTEEHKQHISAALSGENNPMYGKHLSDEHKLKISNKLKGKILSEENKNKLIEAKLKPVVQLTKSGIFIAEYIGRKEAEQATNISSAHIGACCKNERISAGDFLWIDKNEYDPTYSYSYEERRLLYKLKLKEKKGIKR